MKQLFKKLKSYILELFNFLNSSIYKYLYIFIVKISIQSVVSQVIFCMETIYLLTLYVAFTELNNQSFFLIIDEYLRTNTIVIGIH